MRAWMPVWLVPVGLLGAVVLVSISTPLAFLLALLWGFALIPHVADYIRRQARTPQGNKVHGEFDDIEVNYWRITRR